MIFNKITSDAGPQHCCRWVGKGIQHLVIDPFFILWGDKFMQHISKLPYKVCRLNTGLHLIWPRGKMSALKIIC